MSTLVSGNERPNSEVWSCCGQVLAQGLGSKCVGSGCFSQPSAPSRHWCCGRGHQSTIHWMATGGLLLSTALTCISQGASSRVDMATHTSRTTHVNHFVVAVSAVCQVAQRPEGPCAYDHLATRVAIVAACHTFRRSALRIVLLAYILLGETW
jgi:hypothetical protein